MVEKPSLPERTPFKLLTSALFALVLFALMKTCDRATYSTIDTVDITKMHIDFSPDQLDSLVIDACYKDILKARKIITGNEYLTALEKSYMGDQQLLGGVELALAVVESRGNVPHNTTSGAQGRYQVMDSATLSIQEDIETIDKMLAKMHGGSVDEHRAARRNIHTNEVIGILYFMKKWGECADYFGDTWKIMTPTEQHQLAYLAYNGGFGRMKLLREKFGISTWKDHAQFVEQQFETYHLTYTDRMEEQQESAAQHPNQQKELTKIERIKSLSGNIPKRVIELRERTKKNKKITILSHKLREGYLGSLVLGNSLEALGE